MKINASYRLHAYKVDEFVDAVNEVASSLKSSDFEFTRSAFRKGQKIDMVDFEVDCLEGSVLFGVVSIKDSDELGFILDIFSLQKYSSCPEAYSDTFVKKLNKVILFSELKKIKHNFNFIMNHVSHNNSTHQSAEELVFLKKFVYFLGCLSTLED